MLRIKEILKRKKITVVELARRLGVNRVTVYYYLEQDEKNPLSQLKIIARSIGVDVEELYQEKKDGVFWYKGNSYSLDDKTIVNLIEKGEAKQK